jgi:hypothetical protein
LFAKRKKIETKAIKICAGFGSFYENTLRKDKTGIISSD